MEKKYSNVVTSEAGLFDFCFIFGIRDQEQMENKQFDTVAKIFMSPQHAKAFSMVILDTIKKYEEKFGEIRINPIPGPDENQVG